MTPHADLAERANEQLVERLIAEGALWSRSLIAAFRATPRHRFLDRVFQYQRKHDRWREVITRDPGPEELRILYSDHALITHVSPSGREGAGVPISSSSQPSLMAQMLEDLQLAPGQRVLEIGAGTGYNAALLAHVTGPGMVTSIDVDRHVLSEAWDHLRAFPERQVYVKHADGRAGFAEAAPFDRIMVTAATLDVEPAWLEQLAPEGILLAPLAFAPGLAYVVRGTVIDGVFHGLLTRAAYFMPLRAEGETGASDGEPGPAFGETRTRPSPWNGWFDRKRPRASWIGFVQALAFYGLLRGLRVHYQTLANGETTFGVSEGSSACWLGVQHWQTHGPFGAEMGERLWQAFLDAGGPRPTEFRLRASPHGEPEPVEREAYSRQGVRCHQLWELSERRERLAWF
jgi:protein-L-isoaspartate(D-aspartate) O-methyltransferase